MPRFFTGDVNEQTALITGEDARHIALSLRMQPGERATVCNARGNDYQCEIVSVTPEQVTLRVCEVVPSAGEPRARVTLYQAMPKADKLELIVQKSVELGVARIVPMLTERCVSRPDEKSMRKKCERYNRIALEAAKQCGRGRVPEVETLIGFDEALKRIQNAAGLGIFFYENANNSLSGALANGVPDEIAILIGSEGGFTPEEAARARQAGLLELSLGSRILRCETAPLAALTAILYATGEM